MSKFKSVALAASAASAAAFPGVGPATAADLPVKALASAAWTPQWYVSAEGAALISNYSRSAFPGGIDPVISQSKLGSCDTCSLSTDRSGSLDPNRNIGWSGALSIGRDIDPTTDWRLSGSFSGFNTNRSSAAISQFLQGNTSGPFSSTLLSTGSEVVTQTDRFRFATIDFDVGRKWSQGLLQMRTFAGLRAMGTDQTLNISNSEAKGLAVTGSGPGTNFFSAQSNNLTQTEGRSNFIGVGPRVGVEGYYGTTWGVVGAASAAVLGGWRYSTFDQSSSSAASLTLCSNTEGCIGPVPFNNASAANQHHSVFAGVGDVAASLGVAWRPTPTITVEMGYRAEYFFNVRESFHFVNTSSLSGSAQFDQKKDVFINAPYVKAAFKF